MSDASRRKVLKLILGGALASSGMGRALAGAEGPPGAGDTSAGDGGQTPAGDVLVADLSDVPPGSVARTRYRGMPVLVLNLGSEPTVLSAVCTHEGCTVDWSEEGRHILCPCHGGRFDPGGEVLEGPPPAPLLRFPSKVEGGKVYVVEGGPEGRAQLLP